MERNDITVGKELLQGDILHELFQGFVLVHIVGDDFHAEAPADPAHGGSDLPGADDARGLLIKIEAHEAA